MEKTFSQKTNYAFLQIIFAAIVVFFAVAAITLKIYEEANIYLGLLYHHIRTVCGCTDVAQFLNMHQIVLIELAILVIVLSTFLVFALHRLNKIYFSTKKFIKQCLAHATKKKSWKLGSAVKEIGLREGDVTEIGSKEPIVFCHGMFSPKICISDSLVKMLDKPELKSVLLHERKHMMSHEPLKLFVVMYLRGILFAFPGMKKMARRYFIYSELSADEMASPDRVSKSKLASAIYKISENKCARSQSMSMPAISERVKRLSDSSYIPDYANLKRSFTSCLVAFLLIFAYSFSLLTQSTEAYEMHGAGFCEIKEESDNSDNLMSGHVGGFGQCNMKNDSLRIAEECAAE